MRTHFMKMAEHMAWADRRAAEALRSASGGGNAEAAKLYAHVVSAEINWMSRLQGGDPFVVPVFPEWTLEEAAARSDAVIADYERLLAEDDVDLDQLVVYRNSTGDEFRTSAADILTHVFLHGCYHRGQINARLRGAGDEPINVDYITFTRL
ncbi:damage-inducible protein DinB [Paenibacillus sp. TRM 82003]|nr:damage-inducible protein DinB [Paenibacillus sp. TRM 82003]